LFDRGGNAREEPPVLHMLRVPYPQPATRAQVGGSHPLSVAPKAWHKGLAPPGEVAAVSTRRRAFQGIRIA
jgi:hypothetical protein